MLPEHFVHGSIVWKRNSHTMWGIIFVLSALAYTSLGAPQDAVATTPVQIISQNAVVNADGSFNYSFEASNGIKVEESGYLKPAIDVRAGLGEDKNDENGDSQVIQGSFSYTAPDGTPINLKYIADETGFHPEGAHLPTPPPIPGAIQRALNVLPETTSEQPPQ